MGTEGASALIGVKIPKEKLFTEQKSRRCKCKIPKIVLTENYEHCPECGNSLWDHWYKPIGQGRYDKNSGWKNPKWGFFPEMGKRYILLEDGEKIQLYARVCYHHDEAFYAGKYVFGSRKDAMLRISPLDLKYLKEDLKEKLKPLKLWDEKLFGLWAIYQQT